jgi:predicted regulator of Ras-like GTPase activity (Roadblock/LC7/MglB family)
MTAIRSALLGLSDVEGVLGGFVIDPSGELIDTNLPAAFDANVFSEAGPRIVRFVEASAALATGIKSCVLRFAEHKLFVREVSGAFLGVLMAANASVPALKVATNLVARRIEPILNGQPEPVASIDRESYSPDTHRSSGVNGARISAPPPLPQAQRPSEAKPGVVFRGRRLT